MILYEYRRGRFREFRPTFRIRVHTNPILKHSRPFRIIKHKKQIKANTSLIPKKVRMPVRKIKLI